MHVATINQTMAQMPNPAIGIVSKLSSHVVNHTVAQTISSTVTILINHGKK